MQVAELEPGVVAGGAGHLPDEALNAKLLACWQAALNTDDPEESQRWVDMAEWLAHRDEQAPPRSRRPLTERRRFPRVPVCSPALLSLGDRVIKGETVDLSRIGACFTCAGPEGLELGATGSFSVRGWLEDRPARIVGLEPGRIRLTFI